MTYMQLTGFYDRRKQARNRNIRIIFVIFVLIITNKFSLPMVYSYVQNKVNPYENKEWCIEPGIENLPNSPHIRVASMNGDVELSNQTKTVTIRDLVSTALPDKLLPWLNVFFDLSFSENSLMYKLYIKNSTNISKWQVTMTEPKIQDVPVKLVLTMDKGQAYNLVHNEETTISQNLRSREIAKEIGGIKIVKSAIQPVDWSGGLVAPGDFFTATNIDSYGRPISLEDAFGPEGCMATLTVIPIGFTITSKFLVIMISSVLILIGGTELLHLFRFIFRRIFELIWWWKFD